MSAVVDTSVLRFKTALSGKITSQQTQNICITFVQRRPNVFDVGPTLYKCYTDVLCLLGFTGSGTAEVTLTFVDQFFRRIVCLSAGNVSKRAGPALIQKGEKTTVGISTIPRVGQNLRHFLAGPEVNKHLLSKQEPIMLGQRRRRWTNIKTVLCLFVCLLS